MTTSPKILAFAGSARKDSHNKKLIRVASGMAEELGSVVTLADMADYEAPLFNEDMEALSGIPESMQRFKTLIKAADGFLIATPEYNGFFPALIKNAFDWCTRVEEGEKVMEPTMGKRVGIMAAAPGPLGGVRAIPRLRDCMAEYGIMAVTGFATVPMAGEVFDDAGSLTSDKALKQVRGVVERLVETLSCSPSQSGLHKQQ